MWDSESPVWRTVRAVVFLFRRSIWQPLNRRGLGGGVLLALRSHFPQRCSIWLLCERRRDCIDALHRRNNSLETRPLLAFLSTIPWPIKSPVAVPVKAWHYAVGRQQKRVRLRERERVSRNTPSVELTDIYLWSLMQHLCLQRAWCKLAYLMIALYNLVCVEIGVCCISTQWVSTYTASLCSYSIERSHDHIRLWCPKMLPGLFFQSDGNAYYGVGEGILFRHF